MPPHDQNLATQNALEAQNPPSLWSNPKQKYVSHLMVFGPEVGGHHGDYLRHLLEHWQSESLPGHISVVVAPTFADAYPDLIQKFAPTATSHVQFTAIEPNELAAVTQVSASLARASFARWRLAVKYARSLAARHCLLMYFDHFQLPLALQQRAPCPVSGIYFRPTFHYDHLTHRTRSWPERLRAWRQEWLIRGALRNPSLDYLFCLDELAVAYLGKRSPKLVYLPDPVRPAAVPAALVDEMRDRLQIEPHRKIFLLFGEFRGHDNLERKGVKKTLAAISLLPEHIANQCCILVAGRVDTEGGEASNRKAY